MGTHLKVLCKSYPMNTNMTGFCWFSKIFASVIWTKSSLNIRLISIYTNSHLIASDLGSDGGFARYSSFLQAWMFKVLILLSEWAPEAWYWGVDAAPPSSQWGHQEPPGCAEWRPVKRRSPASRERTRCTERQHMGTGTKVSETVNCVMLTRN